MLHQLHMQNLHVQVMRADTVHLNVRYSDSLVFALCTDSKAQVQHVTVKVKLPSSIRESICMVVTLNVPGGTGEHFPPPLVEGLL